MLMATKGHRYQEDFKQQIVELYHSGQNASKLSREYGVPTGTIYKWIKELTPVITKDGKQLSEKDIKALEKRIKALELENEILKKATAIFARKP